MIDPHYHVTVGSRRAAPVTLGNHLPIVLIAGPCQLESRAQGLEIAFALQAMCTRLDLPFIFKASFDKANRTALDSNRGLGITTALPLLAEIAEIVGCPILTDVHDASQCVPVAEVADILQIPAFLCRQTDLLLAAGRTGQAVNVKKGQFLAPWDIVNVVAKLESTGNRAVLLTERGTFFGYNSLVNDMRSLLIMARTGYPVVFDATHSVQQPSGRGTVSGGQRAFAPGLARAAVAVGVAAVFIEAHPDPDQAPSDGPNMIPLRQMPELLQMLVAFDRLAKSQLLAVSWSQP
ncbi:2-Keto-3-deoxy-D-manno-octulosonate-8-phosphate synthase [invertebrate metagenome]|uniref:3-deoxy-8-phosphooctulonate synthase n=1 Tax=invertebrate metagenome TaxID=1711999 RepID=A0A484H4J7_9ZZZZ